MAEKDNPGLAELRQGVLVLAVLAQLRRPQHGYALRQALAESGTPIGEGVLYPLLRRLEGQGLLTSEWNTEHTPPRRCYRLSADGRRAFATSASRLCLAWQASLSAPEQRLAEAAW